MADEPTTALDVTIQAQVLDMMNGPEAGSLVPSMILITHDLGVVAETCDKVAIMYAGEIVESGTIEDIFNRTAHPYTKGLFGSLPIAGQEDRAAAAHSRADARPGQSARRAAPSHPRCPYADAAVPECSGIRRGGARSFLPVQPCGQGTGALFSDGQ